MNALNQTSLGDHVSKKMSVWVLVLVAAITIGIITVSFIQSRQMFLKQVAGWTTIVPRQVITNLMDSDFYSIEHEVKFLESTELFSSFCIQDNQSRVVASFGAMSCAGRGLAIKDDAGVIWGYYFYKSDFYKFISPFLISGGVFLFLILLVYFFIRWRIKLNLGVEFFRFNQFLQDIEALTKKIPDIYQEAADVQVAVSASHNVEQMIVNRAIQNLLDEIRKANTSLKEAISEAEKKRYQEELTETALQVAHDIASPLATLECAVRSASLGLSEESRLLVRGVADRLRGISSSLLKSRQGNAYASDEVSSQQLLMPLINRVVQEKRLEYQGSEDIQIEFNCDSDSYGLFSTIKCVDFCRMLSNIINNAVEARDNTSIDINVNLLDKGSYAAIEVMDNGIGMTAELVSRLGSKGVTHGKINGNGLGLHHAATAIKSWGGELVIRSEVGCGTTVSICLPKSQPPVWFLPQISLTDKKTIVVIDDDQSIHDLWNSRFADFQDNDITLIHLYSPNELDIWIKKETIIKDHVLYLCDYEFVGSEQNGIDLISRHKINFISVLVTSRYYLENVISGCEMHGIKLIPKDLAGMVPFDKYNILTGHDSWLNQ